MDEISLASERYHAVNGRDQTKDQTKDLRVGFKDYPRSDVRSKIEKAYRA